MTSVLAIDPGRNHCGFAYLVDNTLRVCNTVELPAAGKTWSLEDVCRYHAGHIGGYLDRYRVDRVVVERMGLRKIDGTASRLVALGNDLLGLQAIGAYAAGRLGGHLEYVQHFPCPKEVTQNRVSYILTPEELKLYHAVKGKKDDVADAVAHGLRACGRL